MLHLEGKAVLREITQEYISNNILVLYHVKSAHIFMVTEPVWTPLYSGVKRRPASVKLLWIVLNTEAWNKAPKENLCHIKQEAASLTDLPTLWSLVVEGPASEQELAAHGLATEHA